MRPNSPTPAYEGTLAPPGEYDWTSASFTTPESTTQTANRSVQSFLHSSRHNVPILCNGRSFPFKINYPFPWGSEPHIMHDSLDPSDPKIQTVSRSVQPFLHRWPHSVPIPYNRPPLFPQKCPFPWVMWAPSNAWFLWLPSPQPKTASRSVQPFLQGSLV